MTMDFAVEIALVVMISVWTLVSLVLGVMVYMVIEKVKIAVDRFNGLLATGQQVADDVRAPVQAVADSVREVFAPNEPPTALRPRDPLPTT